MARKKEERAIRAAYKKEKKAEKYLTDDESLGSFTLQLNKLGLELRPIPGDGNCLFRALGDQVDGHSRCHLVHRRDVAQFMSEHRGDFEPFVEDDVPFEKHVICLSSPGTYAGNDAIVAFARLHQLTVVIHQLNSPLWEIHGTTKASSRQIHISYHNGDHYSSVRRLGDLSELPNSIRVLNGKLVGSGNPEVPRLPAVLQSTNSSSISGWKRSETGVATGDGAAEPADTHCKLQDGCNGHTDSGSSVTDSTTLSCINNLALLTGCKDKGLILELWQDHGYDFESTVSALRTVMSGASSPVSSDHQTTSSDSDTSTPSAGNAFYSSAQDHTANGHADDAGAKSKAKQQVSKSHRRRERKLVKKAKAEERHRQKVLGDKLTSSGGGRGHGKAASSDESDGDSLVSTLVINEQLKILQI